MKLFSKIKDGLRAAQGIFNSADEKSIKMSEIIDLFSTNGGGEYGEDLSEITYFICLKALSESIGKIPIYLLDAEKRRIVEHETKNILQVSCNGWQTPAQLFTLSEYNRNHYGNAYCFIKRDKNGELKSLIPLDPRCVQVWIDNLSGFDNRRYFYFYADTRTGKNFWLNSEDVLHFRNWICEDNGIVGRSVREILARTLTGSKASSKYLNQLYSNGMLANLAVKYVGDLSAKQQNTLLDAIEKQARDKNRKMITLPLDFTVQPLDLKLTDSQFFELKQFSSLQIAAAFGVKPNFLNDFSKSSYSNSVMQQLTFYVDSLLPIIVSYEQELNRKLLTSKELSEGKHFKFNVGVLLRNDPTAQADIIQKLIQSGVYSINEARNLVDREPCKNGDKHLANGSYVALEDLGIAYKNKGGENFAENNESDERNG